MLLEKSRFTLIESVLVTSESYEIQTAVNSSTVISRLCVSVCFSESECVMMEVQCSSAQVSSPARPSSSSPAVRGTGRKHRCLHLSIYHPHHPQTCVC